MRPVATPWIAVLAVLAQAGSAIADEPVAIPPTKRDVWSASPTATMATADALPKDLFVVRPNIDVIRTSESSARGTTDVGSFVQQSYATSGVTTQKRSPITGDLRIRGSRTGQIIGAGSLWNPGREDLDTALNKIFAYNLDEVVVIKGPYSVRYGPGFNFVEMRLQQAPIVAGGTPVGGQLSLDYQTNGQQFLGRQHVFGGDENWGFRVNYGHGTGNDYLAGNGRGVPASFQSRDLYATIGHRIDSEKRIDFSYIRLDQTDVEYPALVYDVNFLVTDGFELEFTDAGSRFGELAAEAWYNRTRFEGDSNRPGKLKQLPDLATEFSSPRLATDVDGSSLGYRLAVTRDWNAHTVGLGTDLSYLDQTLNDRETAGPNSGNNFPIPHSNSVDVGLFADMQSNLASRVNANAGARIDHASYRSSRIVPGTPLPIDLLKQAELDREFELWSAYLSIDYLCTDRLTLTVAGGAGQRAPTFTELYAVQSFIGTLQRGLTFVNGDPELRKEQLRQIDLIANWRSDRIRFRATGYYAWIEDYITYDLTIPTVRRGGLSTGVAFVNTDLATLSGFELDGSWDVNRRVDIFANMSFVEGRDHTRNKPSRQGGLTRSGSFLREEPLPGIPPFEANLGMRLSDPSPDRLWNVEFLGRFVDRQDRIAQTLLEKPTRGFVTGDIRSFWRLTDRLDLFVGIENVADRKYLEHLDYRAGKGLLRRGRSWNFGIDFRL